MLVPGRRIALVLVALAAVAGRSLTVALADDSGDPVTVTVYGGAGAAPVTATITVAALEDPHQACQPYTGDASPPLYGPNGTPEPAPSIASGSSWSLASVLACITPPVTGNLQGVVVTDGAGRPEQPLTAADLEPATSPFVAGLMPVVWSDGTLLNYYRPPLSSSDDNQADLSQGDSLGVAVYEGPSLTVTARASATSVTAGATIDFAAASGDSAATYTWDFDGAAAASATQDPAVTFAAAGTYDVSVQASDTATGAIGRSTPIPITVTAATQSSAPAGPTPQTGGGTKQNARSPTGPRTSGGATPRSKPGVSRTSSQAPSRTRGVPPSHRTTGASAPPGSTRSIPTSSGGTRSTPTGTDPTTTVPATTGTTPAPRRVAAPTRTPTPRPEPTRTPRPRTEPTPATPPKAATPAGRRVTGRAIGDVVPVTAGRSPLVAAQATVATAPPLRRQIRASPIPALAATLAIVVLLGLGATRERRGPRGLRFGA